MKHSLSLKELNLLVRKTVELTLPSTYWVEAELSEARESNGHCYMELVQKEEQSNTPVARASAKCWRSTWQLVRPHFERVTGERLHAGMKVLLQVYAQFHETYGFSWIVTDIDPTFTLGDMARRRQEIIRVLKEEGVFELNKELALPLFAQRIAVISSATAAGYGDFCDQLAANPYGFRFEPVLFPAVMQGERVEQSVITALNMINEDIDSYDCVVIIRGGGAVSDLSGFDSLALAENIANFPLPVITGIGHERDESVADMVAHTKVKTPTAAAALLTDNLKAVADRISGAQDRIVNAVIRRMETERMRLDRVADSIPVLFSLVNAAQQSLLDGLAVRLRSAAGQLIDRCSHNIDMMSSALPPSVSRRIMVERHRLDILQNRTEALDPERLLRRGYSITLHNGHALLDGGTLNEGDIIETRLACGTVMSAVTENYKPKKK